MTDDFRGRIEQLAEGVPEGRPDLGSVINGGRRHKFARVLSSAVAVVALASGAVWAGSSLNLGTPPGDTASHDDGTFTPAAEGEPTYVLTDLEIQHPYDDRNCLKQQGSNSPCSTSDMVGVSYEWQWATDVFPGAVMCRIEVFRGDTSVGSTTWELSGLELTSRRPDVVGINIPGPVPDRADGACEASRTPVPRSTEEETRDSRHGSV